MDSQLFNFHNKFIKELPGEVSKDKSSRYTPNVSYTTTDPTPVKDPRLILWSEELAETLDIRNPTTSGKSEALILSGNEIQNGSTPYAVRYAGYQFGNWAGQLGDGRAIALGEHINNSGERFEIQLKGAGVTPYSRRGDGRAVFRSSLREFLCSEYMHHLGIPTTRALALVNTGDMVIRDMFYDGHPEEELGAIVTRVAPTFLRFGNFEVHAHYEEHDLLKKLLDYTVLNFFREHECTTENGIATWFKEICERTASLMVEWVRVGFVHGVMNTDNMSILGLTIDYGPYGFLDNFDPTWTPNTTDKEHRRYRYEAQAQIAYWNLARLGEALLPLMKQGDLLNSGLEHYRNVFHDKSKIMMANKLGFTEFKEEEDLNLLSALNEFLTSSDIDMTIFYRNLSTLSDTNNLITTFEECFYDLEIKEDSLSKLTTFANLYTTKIKKQNLDLLKISSLINNTNPYFTLRNYLVVEAIEDFQSGSRDKMDKLFTALKTPYEENENTKPYFKKRPDWAKEKAGCSMLSCSS